MPIIFPENYTLPLEDAITEQPTDYREDATGIISRVAYLTGVPKRI